MLPPPPQKWPACLLLCIGTLSAAPVAAKCETLISKPGSRVHVPMPLGRVNLVNLHLQPPGSVLANAALPATHWPGANAGAALWRCDKQDLRDKKVYFLVAVNGSSQFLGHDPVPGEYVGGQEGVYATLMHDVGLRQTMDGVTLSRNWKRVELHTWDEDAPSSKWAYIRLEHLPPLYAELYRTHRPSAPPPGGAPRCPLMSATPQGTPYTCPHHSGYLQLAGPGLKHDKEGDDSDVSYKAWEYGNGFGYSLYNQVSFSNTPSCGVRYATPQVRFPAVSVEALERGGSAEARFSIEVECSEDMTAGTKSGETAIGLQVSSTAYRAAQARGQVTPSGGVRYLLSDGYGTDPGVATGVGIALYNPRGNEQRYFLGPWAGAVGTGHRGGSWVGWYSVSYGAEHIGMAAPEHIRLRLDLMARLTRLPDQTITPGKVRATAHVLVKVQ